MKKFVLRLKSSLQPQPYDDDDLISLSDCYPIFELPSTPSPDTDPVEVPAHVETNMDKIMRYKLLPNYKQKSKEWLEQRNNYLTASTIAAAIGLAGNTARNNLLLNKVSNGQIGGFNGNSATHWGNKYEPVANALYSFRNQIEIHSFGMVTNPKYEILGISPDGITEECMIEIKCPYSRVIDGKIKTEYYHQMQEQMVVCEFDSCDFLECSFEEIEEETFWNDFDYFSDGEKGVIIMYLNTVEKDLEYEYSPIKLHNQQGPLREWLDNEIDQMSQDPKRIYMGQTYWNLKKYNCQPVARDPHWIEQYYPVLIEFWKEVLYYREVGVEVLLEKIEKEKADVEDECKITDFLYQRQTKGGKVLGTTKKPPRCFL
jgi:putative phage-type endonuclease